MSKSFATNLIAVSLIGIGALSPVYSDLILTVGLFSASGAITNWLAVYMLFERVPGLYGSGVIPNRFEEVKSGLHRLVMAQFFTRENIEGFFASEPGDNGRMLNPEPIVQAIDYDQIFGRVMDSVVSSSFGGLLRLVGGVSVLKALKDPFKDRVEDEVRTLLSSPAFLRAVRSGIRTPGLSEEIARKIDHIVARRLDELTPEMVKRIVHDMIRKHLGWLVVWGGVFGGFIGLVTGLLR